MSSSIGQAAHYREADRKNEDAKNNHREYGWCQILRPRNPVLHRKRSQHSGGKTARYGGTKEPELLLFQSHAPRREKYSWNPHRKEEQHTDGRQRDLPQVLRERQAMRKKKNDLIRNAIWS
jgi:hypothetical protein